MDYVLVNHHFRSSIIDTRVYRKTYLLCDHMLVVSKVRFELKVKRRQSQLNPRHQTNIKLLKRKEIQEYQQVLGEACNKVNGERRCVESLWQELQSAVNSAQKTLPMAPDKSEADWVTEELKELSKKKQKACMRWKKTPNADPQLRVEYQRLKALTRRAAERAHNAWWEDRAAKAERMYEMALKSGRGGSLLKDLKVLQCSQQFKVKTALKTGDGKKITSTDGKLERWREHFEQVLNMPSVVTENALDQVTSAMMSLHVFLVKRR